MQLRSDVTNLSPVKVDLPQSKPLSCLEMLREWKGEFRKNPAATRAEAIADPFKGLTIQPPSGKRGDPRNEVVVAVVRLLWSGLSVPEIVRKLDGKTGCIANEQSVYQLLIRSDLVTRGVRGEISQLWKFIASTVDTEVDRIVSSEVKTLISSYFKHDLPKLGTLREPFLSAAREYCNGAVRERKVRVVALEKSAEFRAALFQEGRMAELHRKLEDIVRSSAIRVEERLTSSWMAPYFPEDELKVFRGVAIDRLSYGELARRGCVRGIDGQEVTPTWLRKKAELISLACPALRMFLYPVQDRSAVLAQAREGRSQRPRKD